MCVCCVHIVVSFAGICSSQESSTKLSYVFQSLGCDSYYFQPVGLWVWCDCVRGTARQATKGEGLGGECGDALFSQAWQCMQSILRQDPRSRLPGVSRVAVIGWMSSTLHVFRPTSIHSAPRAGGLASPTFIWVASLLRAARVNVFTNARGC